MVSYFERVLIFDLDEGFLRVKVMIFLCFGLFINYIVYLKGYRLVMMLFEFLRKGKKNGFKNAFFYGVVGIVIMERRKFGLMLWSVELFELFIFIVFLLVGCRKILLLECFYDNFFFFVD